MVRIFEQVHLPMEKFIVIVKSNRLPKEFSIIRFVITNTCKNKQT